jgi:hypothetical protein
VRLGDDFRLLADPRIKSGDDGLLFVSRHFFI